MFRFAQGVQHYKLNMGTAMSMVARKARRFNVENRAHRVLDQEKPTVAPKYESNVRDLQKVLDGNDIYNLANSQHNIAAAEICGNERILIFIACTQKIQIGCRSKARKATPWMID